MDKIETQLEDIAGIRLICQFTEDIYTVAGLIRERSDMQVKSEKDYITHRKKSGYRSYHIIVLYKVETIRGDERNPGRDSDSYTGYEFLGDYRTLTSI